ncbi:hypothetical protein P4359_33010, partial [Bacillus thuringiensis]|nr:hypothetical protein [Bacillus thuringiensis]
LCSVEGCVGKHQARGLCSKHYTEYRRSLQPKKPKFTIPKEELVKLYVEDGLNDKQIAELKGTYPLKVSKLREKYGIAKRTLKDVIPKEELYELYVMNGLTDIQIAKLKNVGDTTIFRLRNEYGIESSHRSYLTQEQLYQLYVVDGLYDEEIAKLTGYHKDSISKWRRDYGIKAHSRKGTKKKGTKRRSIIVKEQLYRLYTIDGLTDKQIAEQIGITSSHVSYLRKSRGIETRPTIVAKSIPYVESVLTKLGFQVTNIREIKYNATHDLLLNDKIRIDVRTTESLQRNNTELKFKLLDSDDSNLKTSDIRFRVSSGRTKRDLHLTCEYIICVGYLNEKPHCWVIPSKDLRKDLQGISISPYAENSKYEIYAEAWNLIKPVKKEILTKKELERLYVKENLSDSRIAKRVGVSTATIGNLRRAYGIEAKRDIQEMSKQELEKLYVEEGLTDKEIAERKGTYPTKIRRLREKYGIETKSRATISKEELTKLYVDEGMSDKEIAKQKDVSLETVYRLRREYGIKSRPSVPILTKEQLYQLYVVQRLSDSKIGDIYKVSKKTIAKLRKEYNIETNPTISLVTKEQLHHLYVEKEMSDGQIGKLFGVTRESILKYRNKYGIATRLTIANKAIQDVGNHLVQLGFHVVNIRGVDYASFYDLLLNNRLRIDIKATEYVTKDGFFKFKLLDKDESNYIGSNSRLIVDSGRTKRNLHDTCDFVICVGYYNNKPYTWVIPSKDLRKDLQGITINPNLENSRYLRYSEAWHLLR